MSNSGNKILILGSGLVAEPVINYLLQRENNNIMIATNNIEEVYLPIPL